MQSPLTIRMHPADNVAIVANDGGLAAGTVLPDGLVLRENIPQAHKVALIDLPAGTAVRRYDVAIGYTVQDIPAGSWVHERLLRIPAARELDGLPIATRKPAPLPPLEGGHAGGGPLGRHLQVHPVARNRSPRSTSRGQVSLTQSGRSGTAYAPLASSGLASPVRTRSSTARCSISSRRSRTGPSRATMQPPQPLPAIGQVSQSMRAVLC